MKMLILFVIFFTFMLQVFAQEKDSVSFTITKGQTSISGYLLYEVRAQNFYSVPVCLLHSASINLIKDLYQTLAPLRGTEDVYSLRYGGRDTLIDHMIENSSLNGEVILPLQEITFSLLIPISLKLQQLRTEFIKLEEYCYADFRSRIFNDDGWYLKYHCRAKTFYLPK